MKTYMLWVLLFVCFTGYAAANSQATVSTPSLGNVTLTAPEATESLAADLTGSWSLKAQRIGSFSLAKSLRETSPGIVAMPTSWRTPFASVETEASSSRYFSFADAGGSLFGSRAQECQEANTRDNTCGHPLDMHLISDSRPVRVRTCKQCGIAGSNTDSYLLNYSGPGAVESISLILNSQVNVNEGNVFFEFTVDGRIMGPISMAAFCDMNGINDGTAPASSHLTQFIRSNRLVNMGNGEEPGQLSCYRELHIPFKYGFALQVRSTTGESLTAWWNIHYHIGGDPVGLYPATRNTWHIEANEVAANTLGQITEFVGDTIIGSSEVKITKYQQFFTSYPGQYIETDIPKLFPANSKILSISGAKMTMNATATKTQSGVHFETTSRLPLLPRAVMAQGELDSVYLQLSSRGGASTGSLEAPIEYEVDGTIVTASGLEDWACSAFYFLIPIQNESCGVGRYGSGLSTTDATFMATTVVGSNVLKAVSSTSGVSVGDILTGVGLPSSPIPTQIAIDGISAGQITMSQNATATGAATITASKSPWYANVYRNYGPGPFHMPFRKSFDAYFTNGVARHGFPEIINVGSTVTYYTADVPALQPPAGTTVVGLWKADSISGISDGAIVSRWPDSSGRNNTLTITSGTPTYVASDPLLGGHPSVKFRAAPCTIVGTRGSFPSLGNGVERVLLIVINQPKFPYPGPGVVGDAGLDWEVPASVNTTYRFEEGSSNASDGGYIFGVGGNTSSSPVGSLVVGAASLLSYAMSSSPERNRTSVNGFQSSLAGNATPPAGTGPMKYLEIGGSSGPGGGGQCIDGDISLIELLDVTPNANGGLAYYAEQILSSGYGIKSLGTAW